LATTPSRPRARVAARKPAPSPRHVGEEVLQEGPPTVVRQVEQRVLLEVQQVERHERDGLEVSLQRVEAGHPVDEHDELAVDDRVGQVERHLGVVAGDVEAPAAADRRTPVLDVHEGAEAVPLGLVGPRVAGREFTRCGEHGSQPGGEHLGSLANNGGPVHVPDLA
jgi:hypothetical protein